MSSITAAKLRFVFTATVHTGISRWLVTFILTHDLNNVDNDLILVLLILLTFYKYFYHFSRSGSAVCQWQILQWAKYSPSIRVMKTQSHSLGPISVTEPLTLLVRFLISAHICIPLRDLPWHHGRVVSKHLRQILMWRIRLKTAPVGFLLQLYIIYIAFEPLSSNAANMNAALDHHWVPVASLFQSRLGSLAPSWCVWVKDTRIMTTLLTRCRKLLMCK